MSEIALNASLDYISRNSYILSMKSVVSEKGQVTIPKRLRERLGIKPGQLLDFRDEAGMLVAQKVKEDDPLRKVYGILKTRQTTDQIIEALRGPVKK